MHRIHSWAARGLLIAVAALAAAPPTPAEAKRVPADALQPAEVRGDLDFTLANGLRVIVAPDPSVTSAVVHVWYNVGSKDEVTGKTGFAHLFEHLMFEGSKHVAESQFDLLLEAAGGWNNGTTNNDRTNYFEQAPASALELMLWLEADRMAGLWDAMSQSVLDNQRDVVKNERRQSYENQPYGSAELEVPQALWPKGHGNHHPTIGSMADLTAASLADVETFWRTYYAPSNAVLVIVGGVDAKATRALVERYFGWMPSQPVPVTQRLTAPVTPLAGPVERTVQDSVSATKYIFAFRTDAPYTAVSANLEIAAQLIGGSKTSRLYRRLILRDQLATEAYAYYSPQQLGGEWQIHVVGKPGVDARKLRTAIEDELRRLRDEEVSMQEVARATRTLEAQLLRSLETPSTRAENIAEWVATVGKPDALDLTRNLWRSVSTRSLRQTAQAWLKPSAAVIVKVIPNDKTTEIKP